MIDAFANAGNGLSDETKHVTQTYSWGWMQVRKTEYGMVLQALNPLKTNVKAQKPDF